MKQSNIKKITHLIYWHGRKSWGNTKHIKENEKKLTQKETEMKNKHNQKKDNGSLV